MSIKEIKARWAKVTPGSWGYKVEDNNDRDEKVIRFIGPLGAMGEYCEDYYLNLDPHDPQDIADAEAISNAPQDIAELLEVVGECRVVIAEQNHCLEAFNETRVDGPGGVIRRLRALENSFQARNKAEALLAKLEEEK